MLTFDHIGILVKDIGAATDEFGGAIDAVEATARFDDPGLTVSVRFLRDRGGMVYELIAPLGESSVVSSALRKNANIINQLAYKTSALGDDAALLKSRGFMFLGPARPALAFGGGPVQFLMSPMGFILELIEAPAHAHVFHPFGAASSGSAPA